MSYTNLGLDLNSASRIDSTYKYEVLGCKNKFKSLNSKPYQNHLKSKHQNNVQSKFNSPNTYQFINDYTPFLGQVLSDEYFDNESLDLDDAFVEIVDLFLVEILESFSRYKSYRVGSIVSSLEKSNFNFLHLNVNSICGVGQ